LEYPDDGFEASRSRASVRSQLHRADLTAQPGKFSRPSSAPAARSSKHSTGNMSTGIYVEAGHEVLRFFCAYQEERPGGGRRRYTLHYFLADDTLEVKEVHTEGVGHFSNLLRRARLPKDAIWNPDDPLADKKDLAYVTWRDLACGSTVRVWCRTLLVVSCDAATRAWYRDRGMAQHALAEQNTAQTPRRAGLAAARLKADSRTAKENDTRAARLPARGAARKTAAGHRRRYRPSAAQPLLVHDTRRVSLPPALLRHASREPSPCSSTKPSRALHWHLHYYCRIENYTAPCYQAPRDGRVRVCVSHRVTEGRYGRVVGAARAGRES
jgi:hypothetical protein